MVNEKGIIKQYDVVVYPFYFVVAIGDVGKEINARYKPSSSKFNWIAAPEEDESAVTYRIRLKKDDCFTIMIWYKTMKDFTGSTLTHECDHAALEIFNFTGAKVQYDNQEPFCYLAGTLSKFATETYYEYREYLLKNKKKNGKNKAKAKQTGNP